VKAVRYHTFGGPEVLRWEEAPEPSVGADDVLIEVAAAGVNFADLMRRSGRYHGKDAFPAMLGTEAAGTVVSVGDRAAALGPGHRVLCRSTVPGCQAERVAVPAFQALPIPANCSFVEAAAIPVVFLTAYHLLKTLAPRRPGETVLVQAAASGVGTVAIQLARLWGARVFATASSEDKLLLAKRLGAEECINYATADFVDEVLRRTGNRGVDRVLECVGGEVLTKSVKALAPGGRLMIYGRASGALPPLAADEVFAKNLHVSGLNIGGAPWEPGQHRAALEECLALVEAGRVKPVISAVFKLAQVAEAHAYLAQRRTMGKVVLTS
jgi:NADPH2:quinone reductase